MILGIDDHGLIKEHFYITIYEDFKNHLNKIDTHLLKSML